MSPDYTGRVEALFYGFGEEDINIAGTNYDMGIGSSVLRLAVVRNF